MISPFLNPQHNFLIWLVVKKKAQFYDILTDMKLIDLYWFGIAHFVTIIIFIPIILSSPRYSSVFVLETVQWTLRGLCIGEIVMTLSVSSFLWLIEDAR